MLFLSVKRHALRAGQRQGGVFRLPPPYLWTPLSPQRVKGCSPLTNPRRKSKPKNASRCAKTGCGAQRPLRALSGTRVLLTAAPTAPPCIRRRRRSSLLRIFLCFSYLRLRRRFHVSAGRYRPAESVTPAAKQQVGETRKKRLAQRLAFFPFRPLPSGSERGEQPLSRGLQRASKVRGGAFLVLFWHAKENISLNEKALCPAHRRASQLKETPALQQQKFDPAPPGARYHTIKEEQ